MEPLSSFAINIAAGLALNIWNKEFSTVDKEIQQAYKRATTAWSKNKIIRERYKRGLKEQLESIIKEQKLHVSQDAGIQKFISIFNKELPRFPIAFNYLKEINDNARYLEIVDKLDNQQKFLSEILLNVSFDPRKLEECLDILPFANGQDEVIKKVIELYTNNEIDLKLREILEIIVNNLYNRTNVLKEQITYLKEIGKSEFAIVIEKIRTALENRNSDKLTEIYSTYLKVEKEKKIEVLNELIKSALTMFAHEQVLLFYKELVSICPSAFNQFSFAYYLQKSKLLDESLVQYEQALKKVRELSKANPRSYLRKVAIILHNYAVLQKDKAEFSQALEKFEEVLKIYKHLAVDNPKTYLPEEANTLNSLGNLHSVKKEFPQALEKYEEALKIYKRLLTENPSIYLSGLATTLNNLANSYSQKKEFHLALEKHEEVLEIRRGLSIDNPKIYLPDVAKTLNNLAELHWDKKELLQALGKYKEALEVRSELSIENPKVYLPEVAMTLNSMAILLREKKQFPQALENYEASLAIYKKMFIEDSRKYEIDYARSLVLGVDLFNKDKNALKISKKIFLKHEGINNHDKLLSIISEFENKK